MRKYSTYLVHDIRQALLFLRGDIALCDNLRMLGTPFDHDSADITQVIMEELCAILLELCIVDQDIEPLCSVFLEDGLFIYDNLDNKNTNC